MNATAVPPSPYQPRRFSRLGLWAAGELKLKAYGITWRTDEPGPPLALQQAARRHVTGALPPHAEAEGHHGLGFVILHEGREGNWLLMDWWAHTDICCQRLAHAAEGSTELSSVERPLLACVWESVVLAFERDAWVATMLTAHPDPQAYQDHWLPEGVQ